MSHLIGRRAALVLALVVVVATLSTAVSFAQDAIDAEARAIAADLQCPICAGQSVADSQSQLAQQMRSTIRQRLEMGESREQVINYLVDRYGGAILREPPRTGFNQVLWLLPTAGLLVGGALAAFLVYKWHDRRRRDAGAYAPIEPELAAYESQFESDLRGQAW